MTWGFVTCGPNEALVVSGKLAIEMNVSIDLKTIIVECAWFNAMLNSHALTIIGLFAIVSSRWKLSRDGPRLQPTRSSN